jgi:hypothetical protein
MTFLFLATTVILNLGRAVRHKGDNPRNIPAKFGLILFNGFSRKDLNVIFYQNMP